jgi:hypothetical protein
LLHAFGNAISQVSLAKGILQQQKNDKPKVEMSEIMTFDSATTLT